MSYAVKDIYSLELSLINWRVNFASLNKISFINETAYTSHEVNNVCSFRGSEVVSNYVCFWDVRFRSHTQLLLPSAHSVLSWDDVRPASDFTRRWCRLLFWWAAHMFVIQREYMCRLFKKSPQFCPHRVFVPKWRKPSGRRDTHSAGEAVVYH